ncbi:MAG TPA: phosphate ABC transporter permease subunit PstC [Candidatus Acidoferrales bacterium]
MGTIATTTGPASAPSRVQVLLRRMRDGDEIAHLITMIFGASILLVTAALVYELWIHSADTRAAFGWKFLVTSTWDPINGIFGAWPYIYGTLVTTAVALVIAVPLGLGAAIFLSELAPPKVSSSLSFVIDLLAAVPSVIYGVLAIFLLEPLMRSTIQPFLKHTLGFLPLFTGPAYGFGFLTAGIVLAIMVVPFIISVSREVLMAVPQDQREASLGLGATKWETTYKVVVGYARTGILGSVFLSMARALGETMAVTMVIGNVPKVSASLFSPGYSIAAVIANEFAEASAGLHLSALIELGLVLFLLTFILNGIARVMIVATSRRGAGASR